MFLIQVLLPLKHASSNDRHISQTREELVQQFDGVTAYERSPAKGAWVNPRGQEEHDDVIMVEVLVDTLDREWWRQYRETLATRFGEKTIDVGFIAAETP